MAIVNEGGGGGSSTDTGVCAISPSDLVGYTGNALNRIKSLEQRVAELEAAIIQVNQLSDLSQQVGWVGNVEYMGTTGWTQTEYGTLIPPPGVSFSTLGFLLSDGNTYPFVVMDENGVLQYGFTNTGAVEGALISGIAKDTLVLSAASQTLSSFNQAISWSAIQFQSGTSMTWTSGSTVTLAVPGTYAITYRTETTTAWNTPPTATNDLYMHFATQLNDGGASNPRFHFVRSGTDFLPEFRTIIIHKTASHTTSLTVNFRNADGSVDLTSSLAIVRLDTR